MQKKFLKTNSAEQPIITGYVGAAVIAVLSLTITFSKVSNYHRINTKDNNTPLLIVLLAFISMLVAEHLGKKRYAANGWIKAEKIKARNTDIHLIISTLYRYSTLLIIIYLMFYIVSKHYYFSDESFLITKSFFRYILICYLFLGGPYTFLTLKYKSLLRYDFNDYSINLMLFTKGLVYLIYGASFYKVLFVKRGKLIIFSKKAKKIILTYVIIFFFLTLMVKFLGFEFNELNKAVDIILTLGFNSTFIDTYTAWYLMLYHLLFFIDVSLAIIGYTFASRWLDNRTRSVDMTLGGWLVTIMCYPPMNDGFTGQFINFRRFETPNIVTSEIGRMIIMALTLILIAIYVWATVSLSFKFSNLTNRGIVTAGPYSIVRHPAYVAKNISWWLESTFVLSNFWATAALFAWNVIYILRALTEERHLKKDPKYQEYCKKVKYKFIPGVV